MNEDTLQLTALLAQAADGDASAADRLVEAIYPTLRKLAHKQLASHRRETLCTTDLAHEAYVRLFGANGIARLTGRGHLYAAAAKAMRHVLVDYARRKNASKRGGAWQRVSLDEGQLVAAALSNQMLTLDSSLNRLKQADERCHEVVELKFFAGCSISEIADHLGLSEMTVKRDWRKARAFLHVEMEAN